MKLKDVNMQELIDKPLFWEDFEEDRGDVDTMRKLTDSDPEAVEKIRFLDQVEDGNLLDKSTFRKLDFYEVEFTEYARLGLAEGEYRKDDSRIEKEVDYQKDYSNIHLLIQDLTGASAESGLFALYLKDYEFGFINPLGICEYFFGFTDKLRREYKKDPKKFIRDHVLISFETEFWDEEFDLKQEFYDYYHNLPDVHSPLIEKNVEADKLITAKETAEQLGVSIPRVMKMVEDRSIDGYKFNGKLLITQSSVDQRIEYIEKYGKPTRGKAPQDKRKRKK